MCKIDLLKTSIVFPIVALFLSAGSVHAQTRILALGDSITEGIGGAKSYRESFVSGLGNVGCDFTMVGSKLSNLQLTGFNSPHEGYSGHGVEYFLNSAEDNPGIDFIMSSNTPDVVLIHLGSNDMNRSQSISGTVAELDSLVARILNANSSAEVFVANVIPWFGNSNNTNIASNVISLGTQIENWISSQANAQLHLVDVRSGYSQSMMQDDGIHPDAVGDDHIADAFLDAVDQVGACIDTSPPITFISNPANAGQTVPGIYTYRGTASDSGGSGFDRVRIAIEDNDYNSSSDRWWNFADGQFGSYDETIATITNVTETTLSWNLSVTLPSGDYTFYALAVDGAGNQDYYNTGVWPTNRQFFVEADDEIPNATIIAPDDNGVVDSNKPIVFAGNATDTGGSGFYAVRVRLLNVGTGQFETLNNGSDSISADLSKPLNVNNTNWNYIQSLSPGEYRLLVRAIDFAGNANPWVTRDFSVAALDTQAPVATIVSPGRTAFAGAVSFSGNATDIGGSGFAAVRLRVRNTATGQFVTLKNGNTSINAALTKPNNKNNTNWNVSQQLSIGNYRLFVRGIDKAGNEQSWLKYDFAVIDRPDTIAPVATIVSPPSNITASNDFVISGNATDSGGSGFAAVRFRILDSDTGQWVVLKNGSIIASASLTKPGNINNTNWNYIFSLPAGNYRLFVRAIDKAGNEQNWVKRNFSAG